VTEGEPPERPRRGRTTSVTERAPGVSEEPIEPTPPPPRLPLGRIALGLILLAIGIGWLLQSLDVIEVPWDALLPVSLIALGAVLVVGSRAGRHSGLIALGIVLTLVTALTAAVDVPLIGGAGQKVIQPTTVEELEPRYDLAVGQLVIDLRELQLQPGDRVTVEARVGLGELVVEVPSGPGIRIEVQARAALGDVQVLGEQASGFGPERSVARSFSGATTGATSLIALDLSVGMGSVKVNE
jgi:hypothetical protein